MNNTDINNTDINNPDINNETKCSICVYSSLIFVTNVFSALYYSHYFYAFLFLCLTITSFVHHTYNTFYTGIIDKIPVYAVILYGGFIFYKRLNNRLRLNNLVINKHKSRINCEYLFIRSVFIHIWSFNRQLFVSSESFSVANVSQFASYYFVNWTPFYN